MQHLDAALVGRVRGAEQQVLADRAGQHRGILLDVADLAAQVGALHRADVDAAEPHHATGRVVEPLDEREDGRLAGAGRPDERRALAALGAEGHVAQHDAVERVRL